MDHADTRTFRIVTVAILTTMVTALLIIGYHSARVATPENPAPGPSPAASPTDLGRSTLGLETHRTSP